MKTTQFIVKCPFELNDKIILDNGACAMITDIRTIHSLKSGTAEFQYELNHSGRYVRFQN